MEKMSEFSSTVLSGLCIVILPSYYNTVSTPLTISVVCTTSAVLVLLLLQLFYSSWSGTTQVNSYKKKHSPTHLSWLSSNLYQLLPSTTIHSILHVQFRITIYNLTILLHNLSPSPLWSTSWSGALHLIFIHFFTQSVSSFRSTCPYHHNKGNCR